MKAWKALLKIAAVCAALAGVACLLVAYWDKLVEVCPSCDVLKDKTRDLKKKIPSKQQIKDKLPDVETLKGKIPTKEDLAHMNPFRKAEIEAEFADYADVEPLAETPEQTPEA